MRDYEAVEMHQFHFEYLRATRKIIEVYMHLL